MRCEDGEERDGECMTREECKQLLPVMTAWTEGKTIQVKSATVAPWCDAEADDELTFYHPPEFYRIKPEPRSVWVQVAANGSVGFAYTEDEVKSGTVRGNLVKFREVL